MTEAERIEKDAREFTKGWGENCDLKSYIAGATAENERLQQQINRLTNELTAAHKEIEWLEEQYKNKAH